MMVPRQASWFDGLLADYVQDKQTGWMQPGATRHVVCWQAVSGVYRGHARQGVFSGKAEQQKRGGGGRYSSLRPSPAPGGRWQAVAGRAQRAHS